jgi:hypothetical protein
VGAAPCNHCSPREATGLQETPYHITILYAILGSAQLVVSHFKCATLLVFLLALSSPASHSLTFFSPPPSSTTRSALWSHPPPTSHPQFSNMSTASLHHRTHPFSFVDNSPRPSDLTHRPPLIHNSATCPLSRCTTVPTPPDLLYVRR